MGGVCDHDDCPDIDLLTLGLSDAEISAARSVGGPFSRRQLLGAGSAAAALAWFGSRALPRAAAATTASTPAAGGGLVLPDGTRSWRHAMHVHSSASEGPGSFSNQASLADSAGCDWIWATEHDWRMFAVPGDARVSRGYTFTSLVSGGWRWKPVGSGSASSSRAEVTPYAGGSALALEVASTGTASTGVKATTATHLFEGSVIGRQVLAPATVTTLSGAAWFEVVLQLSNQGTRPLRLVYRYGATPAKRVKQNAVTGYVYVPVGVGDTIAAPVTPLDDIRYFFSDVCVPEDNSILAIQLQVTSSGGSVGVRLPRLDLPRTVTGQAAFDAVVSMYDQVMLAHPTLGRRLGVEVSGTDKHHLGWYGDDATNLPFTETTNSLEAAVAQIRAGGSIASFNHPYGVSTSTGVRDPAKILKAYKAIGPVAAYGADVIELGYDQRGGMTTEDHLALGDLLWCDGLVITANGVSDDHNGNTWKETFLTQLWGDGTQTGELDALRSGRVTVSRVGWGSDLWLTLDGRPMGSVPSTQQPGPAELAITVTDLPGTASIQVVRGDIQVLGRKRTSAALTVTTIPASAVVGGVARMTVSGGNAFYRAAVLDSKGSIRQFTNPVWSGLPSLAAVGGSRLVTV